ncbi:MAG: tetratricopeptide repeat protein [Armatimonadota bacterium]
MPGPLSTALHLWRSDRAFAQGQKLLRKGDPIGAAEKLRAAASLSPRNKHIRLHFALALAQQTRFSEAIAEMDRVAREHSSDPVLHLFRGRVLYDAGRHAEALEALRRARELDPENDLVNAYLTLTEMAQGDLASGLQKLTRTPIPGNSALQARIILLLEEKVPAPPTGAGPKPAPAQTPRRRESKCRLTRAFRLLEKYRTAEAADEALSALRLDPQNPDTLLSTAALQVLARRYALALDILKDCDAADPEVQAWCGCSLVGLGRLAEGLRALDSSGVRSAETHYFRGIALFGRGRRIEALSEFAKAAELDWSLVYRRIAEARGMR